MTQDEVLKKLSKTKWKTTEDLSRELELGKKTISNNLVKLYKGNDVLKKYPKKSENTQYIKWLKK